MGVDPLMTQAVFLDRDGVLNRAIVRDGKPYPPANLDELEILPDVPEALLKLRNANFLLIVITNQPDVARRTQTREVVEAIHSVIKMQICVDDFRICYHDDDDRCECRKPKPGLITRAAIDHKIDLLSSYVIGDRWRDMDAGQRAGCKTVFIDCGHDETLHYKPTVIVNSIIEAVDWILNDNISAKE